MNEHDFPAGTVIFRSGEPGDRAYLIHEGTIELLGGSGAADAPGPARSRRGLRRNEPDRGTAAPPERACRHRRQGVGADAAQFETQLTSDPAAVHLYLKSLFEQSGLEAGDTRTEGHATGKAPARPVSVIIHPVTRRAAETLPQGGLIVLKFPYRIGRAAEVRETEPLDLNDLWLLDRAPFNVSRNHALLDRHGEIILIKDRGSSLGIHVNDVHIGGKNAERQLALEDGDNVVVLGGRVSPYQFRIEVVRG